jgi:hypothetical protein
MPGADSSDMSALAIEIPRWELHSELALVSPEVRSRALELLPERDPDALLTTPRPPLLVGPATPVEPERPVALPTALLAYTAYRFAHIARSCAFVVAGLVVVVSLADVLH